MQVCYKSAAPIIFGFQDYLWPYSLFLFATHAALCLSLSNLHSEYPQPTYAFGTILVAHIHLYFLDSVFQHTSHKGLSFQHGYQTLSGRFLYPWFYNKASNAFLLRILQKIIYDHRQTAFHTQCKHNKMLIKVWTPILFDGASDSQFLSKWLPLKNCILIWWYFSNSQHYNERESESKTVFKMRARFWEHFVEAPILRHYAKQAWPDFSVLIPTGVPQEVPAQLWRKLKSCHKMDRLDL